MITVTYQNLGRNETSACRILCPSRPHVMLYISQTITVNQGALEQEVGPVSSGMHGNRQNCFRFQFHHVLHNAGQETIYDGLARDVVQGAIDGISGKLHTHPYMVRLKPKHVSVQMLQLLSLEPLSQPDISLGDRRLFIVGWSTPMPRRTSAILPRFLCFKGSGHALYICAWAAHRTW